MARSSGVLKLATTKSPGVARAGDEFEKVKAHLEGRGVTGLPSAVFWFAASVPKAVWEYACLGDLALARIGEEEIDSLATGFDAGTPYARAHVAAIASLWVDALGGKPGLIGEGAAALLTRIVNRANDPASMITEQDREEASAAVELHQFLARNYLVTSPSASLGTGPLTREIAERALVGLSPEARERVKASVIAGLVHDDGHFVFAVHEDWRVEFHAALDLVRGL